MATVKLTKNELKKQKDALKRFKRFLPTLMLKKQQLQSEIKNAEAELEEAQSIYEQLLGNFNDWIAVFADDTPLPELFKLKNLEIERGNIAGVNIPIFKGADFEDMEYDLFTTPLWVDKAAGFMKQAVELNIRTKIAKKKVELLRHELLVTTQRVNLFEKVKIPEINSNIKKIAVYLGDVQTAAVVRGKISKKKLAGGGG
ncbi:MAG: V-type ATP synthase subunit D [Spirochaetaceae bacterium]|nr:V-type ATP synthase subunit D [Spirochaetaceae bacterium]